MDPKDLFERFNKQRILVVGDVMIDAYIRGKVNRISPEAPVPVLTLSKKEDRLGGAANVALNLVALGCQTTLISVVGKDEAADTLTGLLEESQISSAGMVKSATRKTTIKTRVIGGNQHLLRVDNEDTHALTREEEDQLIAAVKSAIEGGLDALIFEDYNKGVLTERVISEIIALADKHQVLTTVDPKKDNFLSYKGVGMFKPNLKELREGLNVEIDMEQMSTLKSAVAALEEHLQNKITFVTLSEYGVYAKEQSEEVYFKAHLREIADVSGAGDTVISVATACLSAGGTIEQMANYANLAGGLVCEIPGVVAINKAQLLEEIERI